MPNPRKSLKCSPIGGNSWVRLRSGNNLNIRRYRGLKVQVNLPTVFEFYLKRFESKVGLWLGINPFYPLEEFCGHDLSDVVSYLLVNISVVLMCDSVFRK